MKLEKVQLLAHQSLSTLGPRCDNFWATLW
jgi:hypothetical protein